MKLIENKYAINPTICPPVVEAVAESKPRSAALIKAQEKYYQKNKAMITKKQMIYNMTYTKMTKLCECGEGEWKILRMANQQGALLAK